MKHLGDITKINGSDVPLVNVVIGGSPCQDLSIAGRRAGLAGERSGLFIEQIRIIKEMRTEDIKRGRKSTDIRPRYMVWENVPGAFSSNRGQDFKAVLEETVGIVEEVKPDIPIPKGGWHYSGIIMGDGFSVAWRVFDAQFWGVPQRRRRIALVADFGGTTAPEILFERESVSGNITQSGTPWEVFAAAIAKRFRAADKGKQLDCDTVYPINTMVATRNSQEQRTCLGVGEKNDPQFTISAAHSHGVAYAYQALGNYKESDVSSTLSARDYKSAKDLCLGFPLGFRPENVRTYEEKATTLCNGTRAGFCNGIINALCARDYKGVGNQYVDEGKLIIQANACVAYAVYKANMDGKVHGIGYEKQKSPKLPAQNNDASVVIHSTVRRLTPLECERLQGFPDGWTDIGDYIDSKGKKRKTSDSARYKALGNSIALPSWVWVLERLSLYCTNRTMASLFDGIGGFPLIWETLNGVGTCLWASEIEEFPIAVTKHHFKED